MLELYSRHWGGWIPAEFRRTFDPENISIVVIHGRRAGFVSVRRNEQGIYIENLQLSPSFHSSGIGTDILRQVLDRHREEVIRLTAFSDNPAKRLYERLGFTVAERDGETLRMVRWPRKRRDHA